MPARPVVFVYDSRISSLFTPGGDAAKHVDKFLRQVLRRSIATAPVGQTGTIKRSHGKFGPLKRGRYNAEGHVFNTASHSKWVHEGVKGRIYPKRGPVLHFRTSAGRWVSAKSVRGQRANPWISDAATKTLSRF